MNLCAYDLLYKIFKSTLRKNMNKISLDLYHCKNNFMKNGIKNTHFIYSICEQLANKLNLELKFRPIIIPYFHGINSTNDGISSICIFKDKDSLGFFTLHTFNKRNLAYFDIISYSKLNENTIKNEVSSILNASLIKLSEPLAKNTWGVELEAVCSSHNKVELSLIYDLCQSIINKINMTQITNTIVEKNGDCILLTTLIAESHIGIIYNEKTNKLYLDIFSCKYYESSIVLQILQKLNLKIDKITTGSRGILHNNYLVN